MAQRRVPKSQGMVVSQPGGFLPVVDGTYLPHHPFDPTAPAISRDKPLIVGTNKDEMAFFLMERKDTDAFTLTDERLQARLTKELGANAERILATYRKSRPNASPTDLYVAITTARAMWLGSMKLQKRNLPRTQRPSTCICSRTSRTWLFRGQTIDSAPGMQRKSGTSSTMST